MTTVDRPDYAVSAADDADEVVYLVRGRNGTAGKFHDKTNCPHVRRGGEVVEWPRARAEAWREPCSWCYDVII